MSIVPRAKTVIANFSPKTSISGCQLWLDGADPAGNGITPSNGSTVSTWLDKSGNSRNATVYSGRTAGTFSSSFNCVYFGSSSVGYETSYTANPTNETMFIVMNINSPTSVNNNTIICGQLGARSIGIGWNGSGAVNLCSYLNNEVAWMSSPPNGSYTPGSTGMVTGQVSGGTGLSIAMNGSNFSTGSGTPFYSGTTTTLAVDTTNSSYYYIGYVMEIIFYNSVLSSLDRQKVEGYLTQKWGITSLLPV